MKNAFASGTEGKFETEAEFLVSHRKIVREDAYIALTVLLYICVFVGVLLLASRLYRHFKKRGEKRQN